MGGGAVDLGQGCAHDLNPRAAAHALLRQHASPSAPAGLAIEEAQHVSRHGVERNALAQARGDVAQVRLDGLHAAPGRRRGAKDARIDVEQGQREALAAEDELAQRGSSSGAVVS